MNILTKLKLYNQEHLLEIIQRMDKKQQEKILNELENIDFDENIQIERRKETRAKIEPIEYIEKKDILGKYEEKGIEIVKNNKYAVITMAGGQGTRLGHSGPKGTYMLNINGQEKSIFELLSENLVKAKEIYGVDISWYIMTCEKNYSVTKKFFEENNFFGVNNVKFFKQMDIPILDKNGKLLIGEDYLIKKAGNGNGGIYKALKNEGVLQELEEAGLEWVFISNVDNILVDMVDTLFLGLNIEKGTEIASKSTFKNSPNEKVGIFCKKDGRNGIVEYTETTEKMREMKDENGNFVYGQANISAHLFSLNILKKLANVNLPYHVAHKKNSYLNEQLELIEPEHENTYKLEQFIFDAFGECDEMTILNVEREKEFAPIKNATGNDSPETAVNLYIKEKTL